MINVSLSVFPYYYPLGYGTSYYGASPYEFNSALYGGFGGYGYGGYGGYGGGYGGYGGYG